MLRLNKQLEQIFRLLQQNKNGQTILLTPNLRAASYLKNQYSDYQCLNNHLSWSTPPIFPLPLWQQSLWEQLQLVSSSPLPLLLTDHQEARLWQRIVKNSSSYNPLWNVNNLAQTAAQAWELMLQWQLPKEEVEAFTHHEQSFLIESYTAFEKICKINNWLAHAQLATAIGEYLPKQASLSLVDLPQDIILIGFDEITPQTKQLLKCILGPGRRYTHLPFFTQNAAIATLACQDIEQEIETAAKWAKQKLTAGSNCTIAIVVPNLMQLKNKIDFIFTKTLVPEALLATSKLNPKSYYNISMAQSLYDYPMVNHGITWLEFIHDAIPVHKIRSLLYSPYFDWMADQAPLIQLEALVYEYCEEKVDFITFYQLARKNFDNFSPFILQLKKVSLFLGLINKPQTPRNWAKYFTQLLTLVSWPMHRPLNSEEWQLQQRFHILVEEEYPLLELVEATVTPTEALQSLIQLAQRTLFQPQGFSTPIQILGSLEATGIEFDALWFLGLESEAWPPPPKPNSLLPLSLQHKYHLPRSSAQRETLFCEKIIERLSNSAQTVIFSYPLRESERELMISPLIKDFPALDLSDLNLAPECSLREEIHHSRIIESFTDEHGPTFNLATQVTAGTQLFELQAACPFKAFAKLRLRAERLVIRPELDSLLRGKFLHKCLEQIWKKLKDHQYLTTLEPFQLKDLISMAMQEVCNNFYVSQKRYAKLLPLQAKLLGDIIYQWLEIEKQRSAFKVKSLEQKRAVSFLGLNFNIRIDREDELENGATLIIDYKSGNVSLNSWLDERIDSPQLPLYSLLGADRKICAIAYAQVRGNGMGFKGLAAQPDLAPGINLVSPLKQVPEINNWESLQVYWQNNLERLGKEFINGYAAVLPKKVKETCNRCDLHAFCRIYELEGEI